LQAGLKKSGVDHEVFSYDAQHAFFNERSEAAYDAACANLSWERMADFLAARL
jgi:carboxymethylenebutenolidase